MADLYEIPRDDELLIDVARRAVAQGMYLITDGRAVILSPRVLPGWFRLGVMLTEEAA